MSSIDGFVVVTAEGKPKSRKGRFSPKYNTTTFYLSASSAQRVATAPGDAVVAVRVDLDREPVFIRAKKVDPA